MSARIPALLPAGAACPNHPAAKPGLTPVLVLFNASSLMAARDIMAEMRPQPCRQPSKSGPGAIGIVPAARVNEDLFQGMGHDKALRDDNGAPDDGRV